MPSLLGVTLRGVNIENANPCQRCGAKLNTKEAKVQTMVTMNNMVPIVTTMHHGVPYVPFTATFAVFLKVLFRRVS